MNFKGILNNLKDHSGTICAIGACIGVIVTAYFSGEAAVRVKTTIDPDLDKKEKIKEYGKAYTKTIISGGVTIGLIIGSDRKHVSDKVALAGLATLWKDKFVGLDKGMEEVIGHEEAMEVRKTVTNKSMKEQLKECIDDDYFDEWMHLSGNQVLVYEPYTKQFIKTSREKIAWAMLEANKKLQTDFDVRLNYIIKMIGGVEYPEGNLVGWNWENELQDNCWSYYGGPWIELMTDVYTDSDTGVDALCLFYQVEPEQQTPEFMIYKES